MKQFKLPDVGEGLTEAEIVSWKVKPGDTVKVNEIVVEIETAKSLVELPSPYAGVVSELLVPEGTTVDVGTPIITVDDGTGAPPAPPRDDMAPAIPDPSAIGTPGEDAAVEPGLIGGPAPGGRTSVLVGYGPKTTTAARRPRKGATPASASAATAQQAVQTSMMTMPTPVQEPSVEDIAESAPAHTVGGDSNGSGAKVLAKPPVRKLAKDLGVDLTTLTGSGEGGVVTRADVEGAASGTGDAPVVEEGRRATTGSGERETREPIKGVRKMMAEAMSRSAFTSPHVTEWVTVDATRTMEFVERLRTRREFRDVKVSPLLVLARATMLAMRRTPEINSFWDEAAQEVVYKSYVNLGIAAATPRGLVVPNVKEAQDLSLLELAQALNQLTATARDGKTQPAEMSGGTFTITNVGVFGVDAGTPIINPGESAILCFGAVRKQPWVVSEGGVDEIVVRRITTLALSFDHRHVDGEKGSRFLADVAGVIEDPASALLF